MSKTNEIEKQKEDESNGLPNKPGFLGDRTLSTFRFDHAKLKSPNKKSGLYIVLIIISFGIIYLIYPLNKDSKLSTRIKESITFKNKKVTAEKKPILRHGTTQISISNPNLNPATNAQAIEESSDYGIYDSYVDYSEPYKE